MRVAVVGAGISGISAARMLKDNGHEVVVFEKGIKPGGLIRCDVVDGHLFHRTGGHVFNAKDKIVQEWFWSHFEKEKEFILASRNAKILLDGKYIGYPIENYLYQLDKKIVDQVLSEILVLSASGYRDPFSYKNFSEFLLGNFGETLYRLYFQSYNEKIWNTDLTEVPLQWLEGKLPMPNLNQLLLSNIIREEESAMVHSTFYYPKQGGSQFIINRLAEGVDVVCNFPIQSFRFENEMWTVNGSDRFERIIFTGDVRQLENFIETNDPELRKALHEAGHLKSNGTSNMLCETDDTDLSWLYLPESEIKAHRIIYTGNFSETNNPSGKRKSCVVEFSGKVNEQEMKNTLASLPGNLNPVAFNYEPNSYVIQEKDTREKIKHLKSILNGQHFYLSGRFAEWEYYNMDKAILASLQLTHRISAKKMAN